MNKKIPWKKIVNGILLLATATVCVMFLLSLDFGTVKEETVNDVKWSAEVRENLKESPYVVAENEFLKLSFIEKTMEVFVEDKTSGILYRSNPENAAEDSVAFGLNKTNVLSQLFVEYADEQSNFYIANSYIGSVRDGYVDFMIEENGILITYYFNDIGFEIPVYYGIEDDCFTAKILCERIITHGIYKITAISLLPYMGSGGLSDDGYLFIPDGSGSLMDFNNGKQSYLAYSQPVYGADAALNVLNNIEVKKDVMMPVFGIKKNDYAMLAIISNGEYQAEIKAEVSRKTTSNNIAYSLIRFVRVETNTLLGGSNNEEKTEMLSEQFMNFPEYEVKYYFLPENSGYTEMALRYQEYLVEEKGMQLIKDTKDAGTKMNVTFVGGVELSKTLLGVPYKSVEVLTSYKDTADLAKELVNEGNIDLSVRYTGYQKGGYKNGELPTDIAYESNLGGKKEFKNLINELKNAEIDFYPTFDPVSMYQSGNGFRRTDSARYVNRSAAYQYSYYKTTGDKNSIVPFTLLTPDKVPDVVNSLIKDMKKKNISSLSLDGITNVLYSDFKKNGISRNEAGELFSSLIKEVSEAVDKLMLMGAYAYGVPFADAIINVPQSGSEYDMTDRSVPFYQIVLSGYAQMYSEPVNMQGNIKDYLLKLIETGTAPSYLLMKSDSKTVMNTDYTEFFANNYYDWKPHLLETAEYFLPLRVVYGERIVSHHSENGIARTVYENGVSIYVNYNRYEVSKDGYVINAKDYIIISGEGAK